MLDPTCQVRRSPLSIRKDDLYETPSIATEKLLRAEKLPSYIWEPACGRGAIASVLTAEGHKVCSSDLVDYGEGYAGIDFLMERKLPEHCTAIVTNPPYKLGNEFVRHAIELCPLVIMLLRLAFLESESRADLINRLSRVHVFGRRLPMMHRHGWEGKKINSGMAFAWFVWDRNHLGPTTLDRI
jgi:hypothetical protein